MRKSLTFLGGLLAVAAIAVQFIRPEKNLRSGPPGPDDLRTLHPPPPAVQAQLEHACYDCHSNHTRYPWYAEIQPLGWWLDRHVRDGKRELNFSQFGNYSRRRQAALLDAIVDAVGDRTMPLPSYTWIHRDAVFDDDDASGLIAWIEATRDRIEDGP